MHNVAPPVAELGDAIVKVPCKGKEKQRAYNWPAPHGFPFLVLSYGRLGNPVISLLGRLGIQALEGSRFVSKSGLKASATREISAGAPSTCIVLVRDLQLVLQAGASGRGSPCTLRTLVPEDNDTLCSFALYWVVVLLFCAC
jgi:hypothetical protein